MLNNRTWRKQLATELTRLGELEPGVKSPEDRFTLWYLLASVTDDVRAAADAVTNGPGDGGLDAIFIDDVSRTVHLVQAKYHGPSSHAVLPTSDLEKIMRWTLPIAEGGLVDLIDKWASRTDVRELTRAARRKVSSGYRLHIVVITTGTAAARSRQIRQMQREIRDFGTLEILDLTQVAYLYHSWGEGATPLLGEITLEVEGTSTLSHVVRDEDVSSTVVSVSGRVLGDLYRRHGDRLFARNIRGYQGETDVNDGIRESIRKAPGRFFFLNNGVTILADRCEVSGPASHPCLKLLNPQIVNGQQTTRTIADMYSSAGRVSVLAKVVELPPTSKESRAHVEELVSSIVRASNSQNSVSPSDLISNDAKQIWLERALQPLGYGYVRKKMTRGEARKRFGGRKLSLVRRKDLAQAVAATFLDPADVRRGENHMFETHYDAIYSFNSPFDYLARLRLSEAASRVSRTRGEWGYAKWAAVNVAWHALSQELASVARRRRWSDLHSDKTCRLAKSTERLFRVIFAEALKLYRAKRSTGQDVSNFFKNNHGLHVALRARLPLRLTRVHLNRIGHELDAGS